METKAMTLTDFLLARIDEDFDAWERLDADRATTARAYAEIAAKRRIVDLHTTPAEYDARHNPIGGHKLDHCCGEPGDDERAGMGEKMYWGEPCPTLRALVFVYSGHADYRDEWL